MCGGRGGSARIYSVIEDEMTAAGDAVRALARQRQAEAYLLRIHASEGTDQMPLPPGLDPELIALAERCTSRAWRQTDEDPAVLLAQVRATLAAHAV